MVKVRNSIKWQDYAFVFILISDLISLEVGNENIHAFIKPLVVPSIDFFSFLFIRVIKAPLPIIASNLHSLI